MPKIYLSPSLQEFNPYVDGGNEEYYMNLIADEITPYLDSNNIQYNRNSPTDSLTQVIAESNAGDYDFHIALHSNASTESNAGENRGTEVYYFPGSEEGERMANILVDEFKKIYPLPNDVSTVPTTRLAEIRRTKAPSALIEIAYHDNPEDAEWIRNNLNTIAQSIVKAITEYFEIPFISPTTATEGTVVTQTNSLNIRKAPNAGAEIIGKIPKGAKVTIVGKVNDWYAIDYDGTKGYASSYYIKV